MTSLAQIAADSDSENDSDFVLDAEEDSGSGMLCSFVALVSPRC